MISVWALSWITSTSILFNAGDIVLLADSKSKLLTMLNVVQEWCRKLRVLKNTNKSKYGHFRRGRTWRIDFEFKIENSILETIDHYKYLGVIFNEKNIFDLNCEIQAKGSSRALWSVISKFHYLKDIGFNSYEGLHNIYVILCVLFAFPSQKMTMRYFLKNILLPQFLLCTGILVCSLVKKWKIEYHAFWNRFQNRLVMLSL